MTFRRRLTLLSAVAVAVSVVAASVIVYFVVRASLRSEVDDSLRELARGAALIGPPLPAPGARNDGPAKVTLPAPRLERALERGPPAGPGAGLALALPIDPAGAPGGVGQLVGERGDILRARGDSQDLPVTAATLAVAAGDRGPFFTDADVGGAHLRVLTTPAGPGHAVQVARSLEEVDATLGRLGLILVLVGVGGIGIAALLGRAVSRRATAPVARLTEAAEHVARTHDLARRIDTGGSDDELARLARSFNSMLAELERAVTAQRQLVADASHELRTPLTSLRTNLEVLERANGAVSEADRRMLLRDVTDQMGELGVLVGNLVDLARDQEPPAEHAVSLDELVTGAVVGVGGRARDRRFTLTADACVVRGVPERLECAVENLLNNAVKWSPPESTIEISVTDDGEVVVRDAGPGIEPEERRRVFDRFYRAPSARGMPGSGLGLAIVRQIAEAHGGSVVAREAPGGGAELRLRIPTLRFSGNSSTALG